MEIILFGIAVANRGLNYYTTCFIASHGMQMEIILFGIAVGIDCSCKQRIKSLYSLFHSIPWNADGNNDEDKTSQQSEVLVHAL